MQAVRRDSAETLHELVALGCGFVAYLMLYLNVLMGSIAALAFLLAWAPYAALRPKAILDALLKQQHIVVWALPMLAMASLVWSQNFGATFRHGLQMTGTVIVAILLARLL